MSKHTPGPWTRGITLRTRQTAMWAPEEIAENNKIERRNVFSDFCTADEGRGRFLVAACQRDEDARLIAAAPELLAALEELLAHASFVGIAPHYETMARASIAKAKGSGQ